MQDYSPVLWANDIFPDDHKYLTFLKKVFRHEFRKNWFRRISTPLIENTELYDIIYKENKSKYTCKATECWTFRANAHTWIMRAHLHNNIENETNLNYYYYMDNYFSFYNWGFNEYEQIWWEIIWEWDPILDAILIYLTYSVLNKIWLKDDFKITINSMWIEKEKVKYKEELISYYDNKKHLLSEKALTLLEENPMLVLSSKEEDEQILAKSAPSIIKFLKKDSKNHYTKFKEYLDLLNVPYEEDHTLVSKYDYATNSIWAFKDTKLDEILSFGFRYNDLSKIMWTKKDVPATGFYINIYKIINILKSKNINILNKDKIDLYFVQLWDDAKKVVLPLSLQARDAWINTTVSLWMPSMKDQMLKAHKSWAKYVVLVWVMEARNWVFQVRCIEDWTQEEVKKEDLIEYIIDKIWKDSLDFYCPSRDLLKT